MKQFNINKTSVNLTGQQIATLFDSISNQILYSFNLFTSILDINLVQVLSWVSNNRRKKISSISRDKQLQYLYYYLSISDVEKKYCVLKKLKLDKFYIRKLTNNFIEASGNYLELYPKYIQGTASIEEILKMSEIESRCFCSRLYLYPLLLNLTEYLKVYKDITDVIISKYYKFLWTLVKRRVYSTSRHFDEDELYQNYISAALKALDRYDPNKGALTSYIQLWIKNNQQSAEENPEYGIAYELPQLQIQKQVRTDELNPSTIYEDNFSVSLDTLLAEGELSENTLGIDAYNPDNIKEEKDKVQLLIYLAKCADPVGVARLSLGIEEYVDRDMLKRMAIHMKEQGLCNSQI